MKKETSDAILELACFLSNNSNDTIVDVGARDQNTAKFTSTMVPYLLNGDTETAWVEMTEADNGSLLSAVSAIFSDPKAIMIDMILGSQGDNHPLIGYLTLAHHLGNSLAEDAFKDRIASTPPAASRIMSEDIVETLRGQIPGMGMMENYLDTPSGGVFKKSHVPLTQVLPENLKSSIMEEARQSYPTKNRPTFAYFGVVDPTKTYQKVEANLGSLLCNIMPSHELSRCVPFLKISVNTPTTSDQQSALRPNVSYDKFFEIGLEHGVDEFSTGGTTTLPSLTSTETTVDEIRNADTGPPIYETTMTAGMELFTMPQSIVPIGQPSEAWQSSNSAFTSIDKTRPFMSITSFKIGVTPTRGAMSSQRGTINLILHDRGRLNQIASLIKPSTYNKNEYTIEWGWSYPVTPGIKNVYGDILNSLRFKGTYAPYKTSYTFTDDGQINIALDVILKGVTSVNELDASVTGNLKPLWQTVEAAYKAVEIARTAAAGDMTLRSVERLEATQNISSLTLGNVGSLVSSELEASIATWINEVSTSADSTDRLQDLAAMLDQLKTAAAAANSAMMEDLDKKLTALTSKSYNSWNAFVEVQYITEGSSASLPLYSDINEALPPRWREQSGKYVPLAAFIHMFIAVPLYTTGLYDEIQIVTYTANLRAGASAGANLGAIPIDIQAIGDNPNAKFGKILKKQYALNGGRFTVTKFAKYLTDNFIKPHMSVCYGLSNGTATGNSALSYNKETGEITPNEITGATQDKIAEKLRKYYYGETYEGSAYDPRPTHFSPIDLKIIFDVSKANRKDLEKRGVPAVDLPDNYDNMTILKIHVIDASAQQTSAAMRVLSSNINSGLIIPGPAIEMAGINPDLINLLFDETGYINNPKQACEKLKDLKILDSITKTGIPLTEEERTAITTKIASYDTLIARADNGSRVQQRWQNYKARLEGRIGSADSGAESNVYHLVASPHRLIDYCSQDYPILKYGEEGSTVQQISIKSSANSQAASMQMVRARETTGPTSATSAPSVPTRMYPSDVTLDMLGNPSIQFAQSFFINTGTATSIDNLYGISGLEHSITPDSFKTSLSLVPQSAYGVFNNLISNVNELQGIIAAIQGNYDAAAAAVAARAAGIAATAAAGRRRLNVTSTEAASTDAQARVDAIAYLSVAVYAYMKWEMILNYREFRPTPFMQGLSGPGIMSWSANAKEQIEILLNNGNEYLAFRTKIRNYVMNATIVDPAVGDTWAQIAQVALGNAAAKGIPNPTIADFGIAASTILPGIAHVNPEYEFTSDVHLANWADKYRAEQIEDGQNVDLCGLIWASRSRTNHAAGGVEIHGPRVNFWINNDLRALNDIRDAAERDTTAVLVDELLGL